MVRNLSLIGLALLLILAALVEPLAAAPGAVSFSPPSVSIESYDFIQVTASVTAPDVTNPFTGAALTGSFGKVDAATRVSVDGFCDSPDGSVFRIRFMPSSPGEYAYSVTYRQDGFEKTSAGRFQATAGHRRGPLRVDPQYPWHFIWEGTGEHYFFNGTTAFWLMGWREERFIYSAIEHLQSLKINRIRLLLAGAMDTTLGEAVMTGENFTMMLRPWIASAPESFDHPGIDYARFNVPYWQKFE